MNDVQLRDAIEAIRARHRARGRFNVSTNFGTVQLEARDDAREHDDLGLPRMLTMIEIANGPFFVNGLLDDRMLSLLVDLLLRWLDRPAPPIRVVFERNAPPRRKRRRKKK